MRVGELSVGSKNNQMYTVAIENINMFDNKLEVLLTSSKTDQVGAGTTICMNGFLYHYVLCQGLTGIFLIKPKPGI
jgi:hypothetical protein